MISHTGDLSENDLQAILKVVEKNAKANGDRSTVVKRLFSVLVESLQNLRAHGARGEHGGMATCVVVGMDPDFYYVNTGDPIENSLVKKLKGHVEHINSLSREDLRKLYMEVLSDGTRSAKGGAGLGLITIVLRSQNPIELNLEPIDAKFSYLKLRTCIARK